ncbi:CRISPR-associated endonuclease Cas2 [Campylobacter sp. VBCF_05 NA6]|uniref:CRISPR-associated endonuclease Cas2 n=1 Tax=unclassified Campylobacter TaxID=2593542 RepID=UPI0022E9A5C9|nr:MULTISPECIES: CRISPR-associated endonuclease Cas2 [unclassified Campylobacter]MDA3057095.1 CRISPR-associated endonuclease Cas2 [Campylobacter sp. VBCF_04 NA7]MDA3059469.1 CRISPR-associated endonuclease Cas2 [Campylobacter sp. VBCF_05 NA6]
MSARDFIICYDIADKKRLAKVARYLEKIALRVQCSVFLWINPSGFEFEVIVGALRNLIDEYSDDLRIYRVKDAGVRMGAGLDLREPLVL